MGYNPQVQFMSSIFWILEKIIHTQAIIKWLEWSTRINTKPYTQGGLLQKIAFQNSHIKPWQFRMTVQGLQF